ncbi:MAG: M23 family metallopeptidase [Bifidobacteriaceae bacterium]|jgi:murein DD-endopeptidase MepM/ murein hydrolase activator NlpD|nr:M23 family metallopeptidase [Bifidobacteriaceae bacterium]MCI1915284.1 M23 family metallopeptidase [Bifidobacteriaceae bacterium]
MGAGAPPNHHQVLNSSDSQAISIVTRASSQSTFCVPQGGPLPVLTPSGKRANRIAREFDPPAQKWLAGHRGIDIDAPAHSKVLAPVNGTVKFVGKVAGKSEVSFSAFSDDTVIFSFEPAQTRLHVGDSLTKGEPLATVQGESDHCADTCVHWGARRNGVYVDPRTALDPVRIILKPVE